MCIDYGKLNQATQKDHFFPPSLTECYKCWLGLPSPVTWMVIWISFRFVSIQVIRRRRLSYALTVLLLIIGWLLDYVMPRPPFKVA